jgi:hypothetical protein
MRYIVAIVAIVTCDEARERAILRALMRLPVLFLLHIGRMLGALSPESSNVRNVTHFRSIGSATRNNIGRAALNPIDVAERNKSLLRRIMRAKADHRGFIARALLPVVVTIKMTGRSIRPSACWCSYSRFACTDVEAANT